MIKLSLQCEHGHGFDSWFQSAAACDRLIETRMLTCTECGSPHVAKALMAPRIGCAGDAPTPSAPPGTVEQALAALRHKIETSADYVGPKFAQHARDMHYGLRPERAIYGEAAPDEARRLIEDGIRIAPLPFTPRRKTN